MDPRSLVGMTQGARKRAARRDAVTSEPGGRATTRKPATRRHLLAVLSACLLGYGGEEIRRRIAARYPEARARYRIGQRLRPCLVGDHRWPCPGCARCDGSGVLPVGPC